MKGSFLGKIQKRPLEFLIFPWGHVYDALVTRNYGGGGGATTATPPSQSPEQPPEDVIIGGYIVLLLFLVMWVWAIVKAFKCRNNDNGLLWAVFMWIAPILAPIYLIVGCRPPPPTTVARFDGGS